MRDYLFLLCVFSVSHGYHILSIQGGLSKSHYNLMVGLNKILLQAGHEVTFITTYPDPKPMKNLNNVDVSSVLEIDKFINVTDHNTMGIKIVLEFGKNISEAIAAHPAVRSVLSDTQFDAVLSEWFFSDLDAGYAAVQNIPRILLCGTILHPHIQHLVDIARDLPTTPVLMAPYLPPMNFVERVLNSIAHLRLSWMAYFDTKNSYERYFTPIAKARNVTLAPFYEARQNISVILVNSHPTFSPAHSLPPNVIEIGGYHVEDNVPPLPKDLQDILDSSPEGAIYFSMGSNIKAKAFPERTKRELIEVFKKLPQTVLWKFEDPLPDTPKNLHVRPWLPQTSVLAHPNVKAFITHSGLLSTIEATKFGVPTVTIPVFADQPINSVTAVRAGRAVQVQFSPDMAGSLEDALNEILTNKTYYVQAKKLSKLFNDRPVEPKKLILHYIKLAIESQGATHLRLSSDLAWYQLWMLDQIVFFLISLYAMCHLLYKAKYLIYRKNMKQKIKNQ
ncbi:UDP-glucosyltransferase 2-like [Aricia agestis]|uniref:UDP-glucosyltransferase 2-like n=1 Tax=Aricia agestis TaxID=91739 RepID=UPI001C20AE48|nr:UDP-glucosyltransferase 2-like [Aricia agestis]XP_041988990.1 UDP-glucosyltransferase 2-like [Aricia agestis]XP_041988991.1 UDP-glucosyltransferase 2-like [Aricia agestis]XP_041988992.1 UDP-glucosyltransferase 2-like [Aricia agestis]